MTAALDEGIAGCDDDLDVYTSEIVDRFGSAGLGRLLLPELDDVSGLGRGELRVVASLFWCMHVEDAGLPRFVDELAARVLRGSLWLPLDPAGADRLARWHHERHERWTAEERAWLYSRLFGRPGADDPNTAFQPAFDALVQRLLAAPPDPAPRDGVSVAMAAQGLIQTLASRGAGMTRFAADRIVAHVRDAIALLQDPVVARALGGASPLLVVQWHAPHVLGAEIPTVAAAGRAVAGAEVLRWVADHVDAIRRGDVRVTRSDAVVAAAARLAGAA